MTEYMRLRSDNNIVYLATLFWEMSKAGFPLQVLMPNLLPISDFLSAYIYC